MSSLNKRVIAGLLLIAGMLLVAGCGSSEKNESPFDIDNEQHPANWLIAGHPAAAKADPSVCMECHGDDFSGGIAHVACSSCHTNGSPITMTNCASCHTAPPSGTTAPNIAAAHNSTTGHFASTVTLQDGCNTCHNGAGTGTDKHFNGIVDVQFLSTYSSKTGTATYNADGSCSNVRCHGGVSTPAWATGHIDTRSQCAACHTFNTAEYNSYKSGQHYFHAVLQGMSCNMCHDVAKLVVNHFTTLNTATMEGPASATIQDYVNYNPAASTCTPGCHATRIW